MLKLQTSVPCTVALLIKTSCVRFSILLEQDVNAFIVCGYLRSLRLATAKSIYRQVKLLPEHIIYMVAHVVPCVAQVP